METFHSTKGSLQWKKFFRLLKCSSHKEKMFFFFKNCSLKGSSMALLWKAPYGSFIVKCVFLLCRWKQIQIKPQENELFCASVSRSQTIRLLHLSQDKWTKDFGGEPIHVLWIHYNDFLISNVIKYCMWMRMGNLAIKKSNTFNYVKINEMTEHERTRESVKRSNLWATHWSGVSKCVIELVDWMIQWLLLKKGPEWMQGCRMNHLSEWFNDLLDLLLNRSESDIRWFEWMMWVWVKKSFEEIIQRITHFVAEQCVWVNQLREWFSESLVSLLNRSACLNESFVWMTQRITHFVAEQISLFEQIVWVNDSVNHSVHYWMDQRVWMNRL